MREREWTVNELQARNLPHLDWRSIFKVTQGTLTQEEEQAMTDHFSKFLPPGPCVVCGAQQGARDMVDAVLGAPKFTWGLANGEGFCGQCGYPARAYHRNVGPLKFLSAILQYHPDQLR